MLTRTDFLDSACDDRIAPSRKTYVRDELSKALGGRHGYLGETDPHCHTRPRCRWRRSGVAKQSRQRGSLHDGADSRSSQAEITRRSHLWARVRLRCGRPGYTADRFSLLNISTPRTAPPRMRSRLGCSTSRRLHLLTELVERHNSGGTTPSSSPRRVSVWFAFWLPIVAGRPLWWLRLRSGHTRAQTIRAGQRVQVRSESILLVTRFGPALTSGGREWFHPNRVWTAHQMPSLVSGMRANSRPTVWATITCRTRITCCSFNPAASVVPAERYPIPRGLRLRVRPLRKRVLPMSAVAARH
jgi:hypothetical protein